MTIKRRGLRNAPTVIEPKSDDPGYVWGRYYSDARGAGITPKITEPLPDDPGYVWNRYYDLAKTFGPSARMAGSRRSGGAAAGDEKALSTLYDRLDTHKAAEHLEPGVDPNVGRLAFALNMSDTKLQERVAKGEIEYKFTPEQRKQFAVYASAIDEIRDGEDLRPEEKMEAIARIQEKMVSMAPKPELIERQFPKGQGMGEVWQDGMVRYFRDDKGRPQELNSITGDDYNKMQERAQKAAEVETPEMVDGVATDGTVKSTNWETYFNSMVSQIRGAAMLKNLDYEVMTRGQGARPGIEEVVLLALPIEEQKKIAKKYGVILPESEDRLAQEPAQQWKQGETDLDQVVESMQRVLRGVPAGARKQIVKKLDAPVAAAKQTSQADMIRKLAAKHKITPEQVIAIMQKRSQSGQGR